MLLTLIAAVLFVLGWTAGKASLLLLWLWSGLAVGWDSARARRDDPVGAR